MAIKAVVFDCFGVLLVAGIEIVRQEFPDKLKEIDEAFLAFDYGLITRAELNLALSQITGLPSHDIETKYWGINVRNEKLFDWARELKQTGLYKIGMLSNVGLDTMKNFIDDDEQKNLFDALFLSSDETIVKPDPRAFEIIAERLGVETHECVMIDDRMGNIDGASKAGMHGILYCSLHQTKVDLNRILDEKYA